MAGEHVLGILPTGTGKSLCYQIPALSRYDKTGAPHGGDLAPGRTHGGSGDGARGARHRLLRRDQRTAVPPGTFRRARPCPARRRRHSHHLSRAAPQPLPPTGAEPARDRSLGAGRGALPLQVGPRLPAGLPLCRTLHPGEERAGISPAGAVSDRHRQARRSVGPRVALPGRARNRAPSLRRRRPALQPRVHGWCRRAVGRSSRTSTRS